MNFEARFSRSRVRRSSGAEQTSRKVGSVTARRKEVLLLMDRYLKKFQVCCRMHL